MRMKEVPMWAWLSVLCKFSESTIIRSLYPFVNSLADMLGVSPEEIAFCISFKEVGYAIMPLFGPYLASCVGGGPVSVRVGSGVALAACSLLIGFANSFVVFVVAVLLIGAAKSLGEVGTQMMVTECLTRDARGRVVAIIEIAWGLSSLIGVPVFGLLMSVAWVWPWAAFAVVATLSCGLLHVWRPRQSDTSTADDGRPHSDPESPSNEAATHRQKGQLRRYCELLGTPEGRSVAIGATLISVAADALFVSFGVWLEEVYQLDLTSIAFASVSMGVADIAAELLLTFTMHAYSPPVSLSAGWLMQLVSYAALPWLTTPQNGVVFSVCVFAFQVFTFEYAVVSLMGSTSYLDSRVCGGQGGDMESLQFVAMGTGRIIGAPLGLKLLTIGRVAGAETSLLLGVGILVSQNFGMAWPQQDSTETETVVDTIAGCLCISNWLRTGSACNANFCSATTRRRRGKYR